MLWRLIDVLGSSITVGWDLVRDGFYLPPSGLGRRVVRASRPPNLVLNLYRWILCAWKYRLSEADAVRTRRIGKRVGLGLCSWSSENSKRCPIMFNAVFRNRD